MHAATTRRGRRATVAGLAARLLALAALALALTVVAAVVLEASEPGPKAPTIRPLPQGILRP
jgi:hypothetical protein